MTYCKRPECDRYYEDGEKYGYNDACGHCINFIGKLYDNFIPPFVDNRTEEQKELDRIESEKRLARIKEKELDMIRNGELKPASGLSGMMMNGMAAVFALQEEENKGLWDFSKIYKRKEEA